MIRVTRNMFYNVIAHVIPCDTGAQMWHYPEKILRWRLRWRSGADYVEVARADLMLARPYPHPIYYYLDPRWIRTEVSCGHTDDQKRT